MRKHQRRALAVVVILIGAVTPPADAKHWHHCFNKRVTIRGTYLPDVLRGTAGNDVFVGQGGDDTIYGNGGNDRMCGNGGNDTLLGAEGQHDRARGGRGNADVCSAEVEKTCES